MFYVKDNTQNRILERERERKEVKINNVRVDMDARYAGRGGGGGGCVCRYGVGGGGCVARYVGGGGGCGLYDISMVDRMMLKFRPIAPKPMASGSGSGDSTTENGGKSGRSKMRYVRVKGNKRNMDDKKRKVSTSSSFQPSESTVSGGGDTVVTLSLMPETPDRKEELPAVIYSSSEKASKPSSSIWLGFKNNQQTTRDGHVDSVSDHPVQVVAPQRKQTVSFVTVECVTETWVDVGWIGWPEEQQVKNMVSDTCPGFISDGGDRVVWTNKAYREMAGGEEVVVVLVRKEPLPVSYPAAFTCSVRVTCRSGMPSSTLTVPCDAWRMGGGGGGGGGYAWRLDVKAALCLGR